MYEFSSACATDDEISEGAAGLAKYVGLWNLSPQPPTTISDFKANLTADLSLDFSPYLNYPYGTASADETSSYKSALINEMNSGGSSNRIFTQGSEPDDHSVYLYDAIIAYARSTHKIVEEMVKPLGIVDPFAPGGSRLPISTVNNFLRAETFPGASGDIGE